jgi:predicted RND superfamily exporter protein
MFKLIIKYRLAIIVMIIVLTGILGARVPMMGKDVSVNSMMPKDNPDFRYAEKMEDLFGATDQFVIGVRFPDTVYTAANLTLVKELSDYLESLPEINADDVKSIFAVKDVEGRGNELIVEKIVPEKAVIDEAKVKAIRERVRSNPIFRGKMVGSDEKSAVVLAGISSAMSQGPEAGVILKKIRAKLASLQRLSPAAQIYVSGIPVILVTKTQAMDRDLKLLFPIVLVLVMIILYRRETGIDCRKRRGARLLIRRLLL